MSDLFATVKEIPIDNVLRAYYPGVENMRGQDREKYAAILTLLNAGFSAGARVPRCEKIDGEFAVVYFDAFCPKILAGIARVVDTIEDRSFKIPMVRKAPAERVERFNLRRQNAALGDLRRQLDMWATARREEVEAVCDGLDDAVGLERLDDRFRDICEPLTAIALIADAELLNGSRRVWPELSALFQAMAGRRNDAEANINLAAMVELCDDILDDRKDTFVPSAELFRRTSENEGLSWIKSTKGLASFLGKFDLVVGRQSGGKVRGYLITRAWIEDVKSRYLTSNTVLDPSQPSQSQAQSGSVTLATHTKRGRGHGMKSEKQVNLIENALECARTGPQANTSIVDDGRIIAVKICSRVLDACIWLSFDPEFKPDDDEPLTVFYADEIPFLSGKTTDQLKEIHQWKLRVGPGARVRQ